MKKEITSVIILYVAILIPLSIHMSLNDPSVIVAVKNLDSSVPQLRDFLTGEGYTAILARKIENGENIVIITKQAQNVGDIIEIKDPVLKIYVNWHDYDIFDQEFNQIIIGDTSKVNGLKLSIERVISSARIFLTLLWIGYGVTPLLVIAILYRSRRRLTLWSLTMGFSMYCLLFFVLNFLKENIESSQRLLGNLFPILLIVTVLLLKYEKKINWNIIKENILDLFETLKR